MKLRDHPRWSLYKKLRRAIARELEAERRQQGLVQPLTEDDVDTYLEIRFEEIVGDLEHLFFKDLAENTRWHRPESHQLRQGGL